MEENNSKISNVFLLEGKTANTKNYITKLLKDNFDVDIKIENIDVSIIDCKEIDVKFVRELLSGTVMKPRGSYKVYILLNGEGLTAIMQNAMLKTLEEPPEYAFFGILCENAGTILPTLRSRCNYVYVSDDNNEESLIQEPFEKIIRNIYNEELGLVFQDLKSLSKRDDAISFLEDYLIFLDKNLGDGLKKFEDTKYDVASLVENTRLLVNENCNCSASLDALVLNILEVLSGNGSRN